MDIVSGLIPSGLAGTGTDLRRPVSVHEILISSLNSKANDLLIQPMRCSIFG